MEDEAKQSSSGIKHIADNNEPRPACSECGDLGGSAEALNDEGGCFQYGKEGSSTNEYDTIYTHNEVS